jgi:L-seryl-tRNA(Ser) seleniumtransferase
VTDPRSRIPSVDRLLASDEVLPLVERHGRLRVVEALRTAIQEVRGRVAEGGSAAGIEEAGLYAALADAWIRAEDVPSLRRVINATGVVLHTNLGRAPLAEAALNAMRLAGAAYSNLELDLETGARGSRHVHCVALLQELTEAEDALVVNNAAGALMLAVNTLGLGRGVAVSRGELVEIGGGFRIPEVLERAGVELVEVGSTNRTRIADYERGIDEMGAVAVLKVHRSNFRMTGFTEDVGVEALAGLTRQRSVPLIHDLGSGLMLDPSSLGLPDEPTAKESIHGGADVVVVSGDKLLGGPQAGIVVGSHAVVSRMRRNPLCRALRVDKVTLAGLEATLRLYRDPDEARRRIPTLRMLTSKPDALRRRAEEIVRRLEALGLAAVTVETCGAVGGGTFPEVELASWAVELDAPDGADDLARRLRDGDPPVMGRIVDDRLRLDVRTLLPWQDDDLVSAISAARGIPG